MSSKFDVANNAKIPSDELIMLVNDAVTNGINRYIQKRKELVPAFINKHFSFYGSLKLHQKAISKDIFIIPINIIWLVFKLCLTLLASLFKKIGFDSFANLIKKLPAGIETNVEKEINRLIYIELLELPFQHDNRITTKDALLEEILKDKKLAELLTGHDITLPNTAELQKNLRDKLKEYAITRTSASEIASNIVLISLVYVFLGKTTFGTIGAGQLGAQVYSESLAISNFWLGPTIGSWYYSFIPVIVPISHIILITGIAIISMAFLSTFIGIVADPVQTKLGIHKRRLIILIDKLHHDLLMNTNSSYNLKDKYVSRLFDIFDLMSTIIR